MGRMNAIMIIIFLIAVVAVFLLYQRYWRVKVLRRAAFYDELCNCPNASGFQFFAQEVIDKHKSELIIVIKLDVDNFKLVNQTLGREMGDRIMQQIAIILREITGGDERRFARAHDDTFFIIQCCKTQSELEAFKQEFFHCFSPRMEAIFDYKFRFVFGIYHLAGENCRSAEEASEKASIAHNRAKVMRVTVCDYDKTFVNRALRKRNIENMMEKALEQEDFLVYFQAQNSLDTNGIRGAEALVRWKSSEKRLYPDEFIPIFEENNFIIRLDMYVFEKVCQYMKNWIDSGLEPVAISVNFARNHLSDPSFHLKIEEIADRYNVPHHLLGIELTERAIARESVVPQQLMETLQESGFTIYIDDFGTGQSSLGMLKNIPVDVIKLDKSFFNQSDDEVRAQVILTNVIRLAKELGATIIAEGVETQGVAEMLKSIGCDAAQGYYFARPIPESEFRMLLDMKPTD